MRILHFVDLFTRNYVYINTEAIRYFEPTPYCNQDGSFARYATRVYFGDSTQLGSMVVLDITPEKFYEMV